jgi:hypothetical protein
MTARPFCTDDVAASCFDWWATHLESLGIALDDADAYVVGLLASREANLRALRVVLAGASAPDPRLLAAEARAARDFAEELDRSERVFGARIAVAVEAGATRLVAVGGGRVIPMPERSTLRLAPRGRGAEVVAGRITSALATAPGALTKRELQKAVRGDTSTILRALADLLAAGKVKSEGAGRKGNPRRYFLAGG